MKYLHLVVTLDIWAPVGGDPAALAALEGFLAERPRIRVTLVTPGSPAQISERIQAMGGHVMPAHALAQSGMEMFRVLEPGRWGEDLAHRLWAEGQRASVPTGLDPVAALVHLRKLEPELGTLMACGRSEADLPLLRAADMPMVMADSPLDFSTPGLPRDRAYRTVLPGPAGVQEALVRAEFDRLQAKRGA